MEKATKRQVIRRTEKEKLELLEQWEQSGLSIKRFCDEHHFSDSVFHGWLNKYRRHSPKAPADKSAFIPLQVTASSKTVEDGGLLYAEVILKGDCRIKFYQPVSADALRTLIA